jgi:muramidase (phage lysozyme)
MSPAEINTKAFLKLIIYAENKRDDDSVYYQLFGTTHRFSDTSVHSGGNKYFNGRKTTAAGAYQITQTTWRGALEANIVEHFTPRDQDAIAKWKLRTRGALPYVEKGDIEHAIPFLTNEWTALPGAH